MAKEIIYLTAEGYKKLKDELDHMRSVERPAISAAIAEARDKMAALGEEIGVEIRLQSEEIFSAMHRI